MRRLVQTNRNGMNRRSESTTYRMTIGWNASEVRDKEKVMSGLKRTDTPILKGIQIYHNFVRPHQALNEDTPADRAGIRVCGENRWLTIIQNASKVKDLDVKSSE